MLKPQGAEWHTRLSAWHDHKANHGYLCRHHDANSLDVMMHCRTTQKQCLHQLMAQIAGMDCADVNSAVQHDLITFVNGVLCQARLCFL